jgi:hypothetical protein
MPLASSAGSGSWGRDSPPFNGATGGRRGGRRGCDAGTPSPTASCGGCDGRWARCGDMCVRACVRAMLSIARHCDTILLIESRPCADFGRRHTSSCLVCMCVGWLPLFFLYTGAPPAGAGGGARQGGALVRPKGEGAGLAALGRPLLRPAGGAARGRGKRLGRREKPGSWICPESTLFSSSFHAHANNRRSTPGASTSRRAGPCASTGAVVSSPAGGGCGRQMNAPMHTIAPRGFGAAGAGRWHGSGVVASGRRCARICEWRGIGACRVPIALAHKCNYLNVSSSSSWSFSKTHSWTLPLQ